MYCVMARLEVLSRGGFGIFCEGGLHIYEGREIEKEEGCADEAGDG